MAEKGNRFALLEHGWDLSGDMAVDNILASQNVGTQLRAYPPPIKYFEALLRQEHAELLEYVDDVDRVVALLKPLPPPKTVRYPVLFERAWGFGRLFPCDVTDESPQYHAYLQEFYRRNCSAPPSVAAAISLCLKNERILRSEWQNRGVQVHPYNLSLSDNILECASNLVDKMNAESATVAYAALVCVQTLHFHLQHLQFVVLKLLITSFAVVCASFAKRWLIPSVSPRRLS
jgi:hypothetical protein